MQSGVRAVLCSREGAILPIPGAQPQRKLIFILADSAWCRCVRCRSPSFQNANTKAAKSDVSWLPCQIVHHCSEVISVFDTDCGALLSCG